MARPPTANLIVDGNESSMSSMAYFLNSWPSIIRTLCLALGGGQRKS